MDSDVEVKKIILLGALTSLILAPVLLGIVIYRTIRDKIAGLPVDLLDRDLLFIVSFCVIGFTISFFFCKKELGWFSGKTGAQSERNIN